MSKKFIDDEENVDDQENKSIDDETEPRIKEEDYNYNQNSDINNLEENQRITTEMTERGKQEKEESEDGINDLEELQDDVPTLNGENIRTTSPLRTDDSFSNTRIAKDRKQNINLEDDASDVSSVHELPGETNHILDTQYLNDLSMTQVI